MTREELLSQLRDISPPSEPAWWLPAPGHIALMLLLAVLVAAMVYWRAKRRSGLLLEQARNELQRIEAEHGREGDTARMSRQLAVWLKRVALAAYPENRVERLTGKQWLDFLDSTLDGNGFSSGAGRIFAGKVYAREVIVDSQELLQLCGHWLERLRPRLSNRRRR
jgi:hypothetical protein